MVDIIFAYCASNIICAASRLVQWIMMLGKCCLNIRGFFQQAFKKITRKFFQFLMKKRYGFI